MAPLPPHPPPRPRIRGESPRRVPEFDQLHPKLPRRLSNIQFHTYLLDFMSLYENKSCATVHRPWEGVWKHPRAYIDPSCRENRNRARNRRLEWVVQNVL